MPKDYSSPISIRLPAETVDRIERIRYFLNRGDVSSRTSVIRRALAHGLDHLEREVRPG